MQPRTSIDEGNTINAVVGVFNNADDASRVAASLRRHDLKVQRVSRQDGTATDNMPKLVFDDIEEIESNEVVKGVAVGGAIGAGSGLLFLAVPGLNVAAPIAGMIAGAWIGGVAGIAESNRALNIPNREDYQRMLADGKSFVVIAADDENQRLELANRMTKLGATDVFQHPPVGHVIHEPVQ